MATRRIDSDLLLVGSLPVDSPEAGFQIGAEYFGDMVFALPDGETGPRSAWVGYEREQLLRPNPDIRVVRETESPTGIPRHTYEAAVFALRDGDEGPHWDSWPRIDDAIDSYQVFRKLREEGVIPRELRYQIGLPFPTSALNALRENFSSDYARADGAFEDLVGRELKRLFEQIPAADLALQWDVAFEVLDIENVLSWTEGDAWERFAGPVSRLARLVPEEALLGYHLCYGTFPQWPMYEARDMGVLVEMSNYAVAKSGRPVDWIHLAGPRYLRSEDDSFFRPLERLDTPDTRIFLGIVQPLDGIAGLARRHRTASRFLADFGIANYCGFGRQPGVDGAETMRDHRDTVASLKELTKA